MNVLNIPDSRQPNELNYMALILAIINPEPLRPEEALDWIINGKEPEPPSFTLSREVIEKAIELQREGCSLSVIKERCGINLGISSLCRQMLKYRRYIELDFEKVVIRKYKQVV